MSDKGIFIISLDFELLWGVTDCGSELKSNIDKEIDANIVPRLLALFKKYDIHATWATVGGIMAQDEMEFWRYLPKEIPEQTREQLRLLGFSEDGNLPSEQRRRLFAPELVSEIRSTPGQELASHTYTHYYCDREDSSPEQLRAELSSANTIAEEKGIMLQSLVFPRNQVSQEYVIAAEMEGFSIYRGKEVNSGTSTLFWYLNHYLPLRKCSYTLKTFLGKNERNIKSSRLYKPYRKKYALLEPLKVRHYCHELIKAAKNGEIYHIYWHPHNFAENTEKNFAQLETLLRHFAKARKRFGMQSLNMQETAARYKGQEKRK